MSDEDELLRRYHRDCDAGHVSEEDVLSPSRPIMRGAISMGCSGWGKPLTVVATLSDPTTYGVPILTCPTCGRRFKISHPATVWTEEKTPKHHPKVTS